MEARGFALLGDAREARQAVLATQQCYESVSPEDVALFPLCSITLERLHTLQRQVHPLRSSSPHLADLDDRIADVLNRATRRQHDDRPL